MVQNKVYRSFIILQEDERGHSVSNDKPLSGYAKVEAKGDKCKIAFYAQNVKSDYSNCNMVLVCNKKDGKYNLNLGPMNINPQGKAEMSVEYDVNNIGNANLSYDKIVGAALYKEISGKPIFLMCGFLNGEQPKDNWKSYKMVNSNKDSKKAINKEEHKDNDNRYDSRNKNKNNNVNANVNNINNEHHHTHHQNNDIENNVNDEHHHIHHQNNNNNIEENIGDNKDRNNNKHHHDNNDMNNNNDYYGSNDMNNDNHHDDNDMNNNNMNNNNHHHHHHHKHHHKHHDHDCGCGREGDYDYESKYDDYEREIENTKSRVDGDDFELRGPMREFFDSVTDEFELVRGFTNEIKKCKWYKAKVKDFDEMCNMANYNKYTVAYYPMINYYPYISKHGHFMIGLKGDENGKVKYVVYGVPGTKDNKDQPYGGRTGFVTWCPESEGSNNGHWLMFYDYENSVVTVPMK